jgi:S1-C subfamily serine protease
VIQKPTVSFLDSSSTIHARKFKQRNGSIGGDVLKRFKVWIDYPNKKITLKKNASLTKGFNYNMSGLDVIYSGKQLVKEKIGQSYADSYGREMDKNTSISFITRYFFKFKPSFKINMVLKNSPADKAGVLKGDILLKINGKNTYELTMNDIVYKLQERDKKKISLVVDRNGKKMKFQFRLEKKI